MAELRRRTREDSERLEIETLAPAATKSADSRGRRLPEFDDAYRTAFQRDRDRIIHSKAFRRLKHKTQVFINPEGDHYVTRLTHTLQVTQIGRSIARALSLNEDLAEAIGTSRGTITNLLTGSGSTTISRAASIAVALWMPVSSLISHLPLLHEPGAPPISRASMLRQLRIHLALAEYEVSRVAGYARGHAGGMTVEDGHRIIQGLPRIQEALLEVIRPVEAMRRPVLDTARRPG